MNSRPRSNRKVLLVALSAVLFLAGGISTALAASAHGRQTAIKPGYSLVHQGYLTVGSDTTYPPMESRDPNTHQYVGADIDLANALARAMGLRGAIIVNNSFDTIIPSLQRGRFDVIMSSMNDTPARRKIINFVDYMTASEAMVVHSNSNIHADNYSGVCGHTVAVERGTTEFDGLTAANKSCASKITIKDFTADTDAFQAFASGHADVYTGDLPVAALYVKNHAGALRLAGKPIRAGENYGIGVLYRARALHQGLVIALHKVRVSGRYMRILTRWGVQGAAL